MPVISRRALMPGEMRCGEASRGSRGGGLSIAYGVVLARGELILRRSPWTVSGMGGEQRCSWQALSS